MKRRTLLAAATLSPLLGGCGFALRRPQPLPFERLAVAVGECHVWDSSFSAASRSAAGGCE